MTANDREVDAWEQFEVYSPAQMGTQGKDVVDTRWAPTRKEVNGKKTAKARSVAHGRQDPDLRDGNVEIAGCVSPRSSHLQLLFLGPLRSGRPGAWISRLLGSGAFPKGTGFAAKDMFGLHASRIPSSFAVFGNWRRLPLATIMPRRHVVGPRAAGGYLTGTPREPRSPGTLRYRGGLVGADRPDGRQGSAQLPPEKS